MCFAVFKVSPPNYNYVSLTQKKFYFVVAIICFLFQEQLICTDVNEKTMDTMMAGVESITGGIHKHKLLESVQNFEKKNLKPCLLRNPDQDPLALKLEKITIKDHYNRYDFRKG